MKIANIDIRLFTSILSMLLFLALNYTAVGQVRENNDNKKADSIQQKKEEYQPLIYTDEKKHASLNGVVNEFVWQIYQDRKGNYWFGSNHDGIVLYDKNSLIQYTQKDGIGGDAIRAIIEDEIGNICFGTSGGLTKYDGKEFTNYTIDDGLIDNEIWTIERDPAGTIWIATVEGVSKFDGKNFETFKVPKPDIPNPEPMLSKNRVSDILIDRYGHFWFVNDGYGITRFNGSQYNFFTTENGLTDNNVAELFEDSQGNIWIGTYYGGVSRFDGKNFTNFTKEGIIKGMETYNFCEDKSGNIWFSAENYGVYKYNGQEFTQFTSNEGMATNTIQSIYEDNKGQIWFSTWEGISIYDGIEISNAANKEAWTK